MNDDIKIQTARIKKIDQITLTGTGNVSTSSLGTTAFVSSAKAKVSSRVDAIRSTTLYHVLWEILYHVMVDLVG